MYISLWPYQKSLERSLCYSSLTISIIADQNFSWFHWYFDEFCVSPNFLHRMLFVFKSGFWLDSFKKCLWFPVRWNFLVKGKDYFKSKSASSMDNFGLYFIWLCLGFWTFSTLCLLTRHVFKMCPSLKEVEIVVALLQPANHQCAAIHLRRLCAFTCLFHTVTNSSGYSVTPSFSLTSQYEDIKL